MVLCWNVYLFITIIYHPTGFGPPQQWNQSFTYRYWKYDLFTGTVTQLCKVIYLVKLNYVHVLQLQFESWFTNQGVMFFMNVFIKNADTFSFFCRSWIWKEIEYQYCQKVLKIWSTCKHWIWKVIRMYIHTYMYFLIVDTILGPLIITA